MFVRIRALRVLLAVVAFGLFTASAKTITVGSGDTLWEIARRHDTTISRLMALNNLSSPKVRVGQRLVVNGEVASVSRASSSSRFERPLWPVEGVITQGYARYHKGLDIAAPYGTPVYAAVSGRVREAGWNRTGYGNLVVIDGNDGRIYYYAHNSRLYVRAGQRVNQGQQISRVGSTGRSTGPHLHFEIRASQSSFYNPYALLPSNMLRMARYVR